MCRVPNGTLLLLVFAFPEKGFYPRDVNLFQLIFSTSWMFLSKTLPNSRRPYLGVLRMTFFSNNLLMLVLILLLWRKSSRTAFIFWRESITNMASFWQENITNMASFWRENITNIASFREAQLQLLNAFSKNIINDKEFLLLEDINVLKKKRAFLV